MTLYNGQRQSSELTRSSGAHQKDLRAMDRNTRTLPFLPGLRALLFDMGDVLYDASMWRRWLFQLLARRGMQSNYQAFFEVWEHDYLPQVNTGAQEYWPAMRQFLRSAGLPNGSCEEIIAAGAARRKRFQTSIRPLAGVQSTIATLTADGFQLAAVSNTPEPASVLRQKLERLGLGRYFSTCLSSLDVGACMPDAAVYTAALAELHVSASDAAFVGHTTHELQGAHAAGLSTIAVNYCATAVADWRLQTLQDITALPSPIATLEPQTAARRAA